MAPRQRERERQTRQSARVLKSQEFISFPLRNPLTEEERDGGSLNIGGGGDPLRDPFTQHSCSNRLLNCSLSTEETSNRRLVA